MVYVLATILAYLLGAFPTAYLVSRIASGLDIRLIGSGNSGALNVYRHVGWLYGLAIYAVRWMEAPETAIYVAALAVVVGHNWSVFLGFKGGKGVATVLGLSMAVLPMLTALTMPVFVIALAATRNVIVSMVAGFLALNLLVIVTLQPLPMIILCLTLTGIVAVTHLARSGNQLVPAVRSRNWREVIKIE